jgi:hypothetical protein
VTRGGDLGDWRERRFDRQAERRLRQQQKGQGGKRREQDHCSKD